MVTKGTISPQLRAAELVKSNRGLLETNRAAREALEEGLEEISERELKWRTARHETVARLRKLAPREASRVRVFRRRWIAQLQADVDELVAELLDRTRLV